MIQRILSLFMSFITMLFSMIGGLIHDDPDPFSLLTKEWRQMVQSNYDEFISEVADSDSRIPIIVSTDQHGAVSANSAFYKYIDSVVDWNKISKIINLGDTVSNSYNEKELSAYLTATECLPGGKRIEVIGNHDRTGLSDAEGAEAARRYFRTSGAVYSDDGKAFVVEDTQFNIRYLAVDPKENPWGYESGALRTPQADFIINELSKDDLTDIVLISHPYLFKDNILRRDGSAFTGSEYFIGSRNVCTEARESFIDMLAARRNKTAGVLLDCDGVEHPYDFTACRSDFLMTLHGHHHTEGYETKNGITEFMFQSMTMDNGQNNEPNCFYFAYIDTQTKTFKCWKNVVGYDAWSISIA